MLSLICNPIRGEERVIHVNPISSERERREEREREGEERGERREER